MTHKIAKDVEKADRKRKAGGEQEEEKNEMDTVDHDPVDEVDGDRQKRHKADESAPSGVAHGYAAGGSIVESLGGMLCRLSIVDPEVDQWALNVNEPYRKEKERFLTLVLLMVTRVWGSQSRSARLTSWKYIPLPESRWKQRNSDSEREKRWA